MIEQKSPEWHALRCGKVTASRMADMMAKTKTGWGASRANYKAQLVAERLTGRVADGYANAAMKWGSEMEPEAVDAYAFATNADVQPIGFVVHPRLHMSGASPDRLVGADGLLEIKCPETHTHIETLLGGAIPGKYELQMLWQMACTGRRWCDWASYDPRMPPDMRLFVRRFHFDAERVATLESEVSRFLHEVDQTVDALVSRYRQQAAE